jgi:PIN domain nuclease of toxin-antitoxin system
VLLLDTHVLLWYRSGSNKLGKSAKSKIERAIASAELAISALSFWEVATLIERKRVRLDVDAHEWRELVLENGIQEVALDGEIALCGSDLGALSADPIDRFIVATALVGGHVLLTADESILQWPGQLRRVDASL